MIYNSRKQMTFQKDLMFGSHNVNFSINKVCTNYLMCCYNSGCLMYYV